MSNKANQQGKSGDRVWSRIGTRKIRVAIDKGLLI
jgi:hypothetical protein